jgi:hypothetical protein
MEEFMQKPSSGYFLPFKIFSFLVLLLMALAVIYAAFISFVNWTGINV